MKKYILLGLVVCLFSCQDNSVNLEDPTHACGQAVTRSEQALSAAVAYSKVTGDYYFESLYLDSPKSTVDSTNQGINVFCELPNEFKVVGKVLKFDGHFAPIVDTTGHEGILKKTFRVSHLNYVAISKIY